MFRLRERDPSDVLTMRVSISSVDLENVYKTLALRDVSEVNGSYAISTEDPLQFSVAGTGYALVAVVSAENGNGTIDIMREGIPIARILTTIKSVFMSTVRVSRDRFVELNISLTQEYTDTATDDEQTNKLTRTDAQARITP